MPMNSLLELLLTCARSLLRLFKSIRLLALLLLRRDWFRSIDVSSSLVLPDFPGLRIPSMTLISSPHSFTSLLSCKTSSPSFLFSSLFLAICADRNYTILSNLMRISSCEPSIALRECIRRYGSCVVDAQRSSQDLKGEVMLWGLCGEAVEGDIFSLSLRGLGGGCCCWLDFILVGFICNQIIMAILIYSRLKRVKQQFSIEKSAKIPIMMGKMSVCVAYLIILHKNRLKKAYRIKNNFNCYSMKRYSKRLKIYQ